MKEACMYFVSVADLGKWDPVPTKDPLVDKRLQKVVAGLKAGKCCNTSILIL